uniref:Uncharacterized protein n=1 Tax=Chenopodium quinoa TaxID=63459 RepID=A0A803NAJ0_CHEQI
MRRDDGQRKADTRQYRSLVGSLLYLTATRPNLMFAASLLSRFMSEPSDVHMGAATSVCFSKTKHMKMYYALREVEQEKEVKLIHCPTEFQLADILTKALPKSRFEFLRLKLGK